MSAADEDVRQYDNARVAKGVRAEVVAALTAAMHDSQAVRIDRAPDAAAPVRGHVVVVGIRWFVVQPTSPTVLVGGYTAVRLRDVRRVRTLARSGAFDVAAIGATVAAPVGVDPTTTGTLLSTASELFGILAVHSERRRRPKWWLGRVRGIADKQLSFAVVDVATLVTKKTRTVPFRDITRVDFGGRPVSD